MKNTKPKNIDEAAIILLEILAEKQKNEIRQLKNTELLRTHFALGTFVRNYFRLWSEDCHLLGPKEIYPMPDPDSISFEIIVKAWEHLQKQIK